MTRMLAALVAIATAGLAGIPAPQPEGLDARVQKFLQNHRNSWHDMNVPARDGQALHDLIVQRGYTRALEIGTSTGHSGIWIAWALAKTGGKLITVEIDRSRHDEAVGHFKEAGLSQYIDARFGDAHALVPALEGPFDIVFIDADKGWYVNYAKAVLSKLVPGGAITAHNVSGRGYRRRMGGDYYTFMTSLPDFETTIVNGQLAISLKKN